MAKVEDIQEYERTVAKNLRDIADINIEQITETTTTYRQIK